MSTPGTHNAGGRRVLLLGGAGFIGSNLAHAFAARGDVVTVIDAFLADSAARAENLHGTARPVELVRGAVESVPDLAARVTSADLIVDAMALTAHHVGMAEPRRDLEANLLSHLALIEALRGMAGKRVIYLGSRGQYGRVSMPGIDEGSLQTPLDPQGVHKAAAEHLLRIYAAREGYSVVSLRLTNTFGERQNVRGRDLGLVGSFVRDLLDGKTVEVFGDADRKKSLAYVGDVVRVVLAFADRVDAGFAAYNVAGHEVSLGRLLDALVRLVGSGAWAVKPFPAHVKQMDVGEARFSDAALRALLGPLASTPLEDALARTVAYFREQQS